MALTFPADEAFDFIEGYVEDEESVFEAVDKLLDECSFELGAADDDCARLIFYGSILAGVPADKVVKETRSYVENFDGFLSRPLAEKLAIIADHPEVHEVCDSGELHRFQDIEFDFSAVVFEEEE